MEAKFGVEFDLESTFAPKDLPEGPHRVYQGLTLRAEPTERLN